MHRRVTKTYGRRNALATEKSLASQVFESVYTEKRKNETSYVPMIIKTSQKRESCRSKDGQTMPQKVKGKQTLLFSSPSQTQNSLRDSLKFGDFSEGTSSVPKLLKVGKKNIESSSIVSDDKAKTLFHSALHEMKKKCNITNEEKVCQNKSTKFVDMLDQFESTPATTGSKNKINYNQVPNESSSSEVLVSISSFKTVQTNKPSKDNTTPEYPSTCNLIGKSTIKASKNIDCKKKNTAKRSSSILHLEVPSFKQFCPDKTTIKVQTFVDKFTRLVRQSVGSSTSVESVETSSADSLSDVPVMKWYNHHRDQTYLRHSRTKSGLLPKSAKTINLNDGRSKNSNKVSCDEDVNSLVRTIELSNFEKGSRAVSDKRYDEDNVCQSLNFSGDNSYTLISQPSSPLSRCGVFDAITTLSSPDLEKESALNINLFKRKPTVQRSSPLLNESHNHWHSVNLNEINNSSNYSLLQLRLTKVDVPDVYDFKKFVGDNTFGDSELCRNNDNSSGSQKKRCCKLNSASFDCSSRNSKATSSSGYSLKPKLKIYQAPVFAEELSPSTRIRITNTKDNLKATVALCRRLPDCSSGSNSRVYGRRENLKQSIPLLKKKSINSSLSVANSICNIKAEHSLVRSLSRNCSTVEDTQDGNTRRLLTSPKRASTGSTAAYNPRQWNDPDTSQFIRRTSVSPKDYQNEYVSVPASIPVVTRTITCPLDSGKDSVTKISVASQYKSLFAVVRHVRQAHVCQEYGEMQEFRDDIDYILDGLDNSQAQTTRCLSLLNLANKCLEPGFRLHVRAHNTLSSVFSLTHDAPQDPMLSLCLACLLFTLSSECFLSLDHDALNLERFLALLASDVSPSVSDSTGGVSSVKPFGQTRLANVQRRLVQNDGKGKPPEFERKRKAVFDICSRAGPKNKAVHTEWKLEDITTRKLMMETLLSVTSRQISDWLRSALRNIAAFEHVIDEVVDTVTRLEIETEETTTTTLNIYIRTERCLKLLESLTDQTTDSQTCIVSYKSATIISYLHRLLKRCSTGLSTLLNSVEGRGTPRDTDDDGRDVEALGGGILSSCLLTALRLLLNLTNENETSCGIIGQEPGMLETLVTCVTCAEHMNLPDTARFDLHVLGLGILINLVEMCRINRELIIQLKTTCPINGSKVKNEQKVDFLKALALLFNVRYNAVRIVEERHDAEIEDKQKEGEKRLSEEEEEEGVNNLRTRTSLNSTAQRTLLEDESGKWQTSEFGHMWVSRDDPDENSETTEKLQRVGYLRSETITVSAKLRARTRNVRTNKGDCRVVDGDGEDYMKDLHTAGKHMEDSIITAYISQLIGCLIEHDTKSLSERIRPVLPDDGFSVMVEMLKKFLGFMNVTTGARAESSKSIERIIVVLESCR